MGRHQEAGMTMIELMVVIAILAILATIAVPNFQAFRTKARYASFTSEVLMIAQAIRSYYIYNDQYPADVSRGTVPPRMEHALAGVMTRPTPLGGVWDWDNNVFGVTAGISVVNPSASVQDMQGLDRYLDDGDLATGTFRRNSNRYIYILEE